MVREGVAGVGGGARTPPRDNGSTGVPNVLVPGARWKVRRGTGVARAAEAACAAAAPAEGTNGTAKEVFDLGICCFSGGDDGGARTGEDPDAKGEAPVTDANGDAVDENAEND